MERKVSRLGFGKESGIEGCFTKRVFIESQARIGISGYLLPTRCKTLIGEADVDRTSLRR